MIDPTPDGTRPQTTTDHARPPGEAGETGTLGGRSTTDYVPESTSSTTGAGPTLPDDGRGAGADVPASVGRFVVRARLGEGAFGEVFRAFDPRLDREVALKVARPGTLTTPERARRFLREARAAANLRHPNIVPLFETGQEEARYYIAEAFIPGGTLEAEMARGKGPLPFDRAVALVRALAEALAYAHRQGIVHRDVKPANVLLDEKGEPLLADFGLAARAEGDEKLTHEGAVLGTPAYMSPEQAAGRSADVSPASDQ
jgi:serine/threonine protein kinase